MNKVKILFLAAYPDASHLKLDEEIRAITQKIRASEYRDSLDLISAWAVRPDDLLQILNEHKPHIVHFSGHGNPSGAIILLDETLINGKRVPKPVSPAAIKALFQVLKDNVQVVLLNACYSLIQAKAIVSNIDCVIGMNTTIGDQAAITFAASFYRAIGFGRSVNDAFEQGKVALLLEGIPEDSTPELLCKQGVDPARVILVNNIGDDIKQEILTASATVDEISNKKVQEKVGVGLAHIDSNNSREIDIHQRQNSEDYTQGTTHIEFYPKRIFIQYINPEIISLYGIPKRFSSIELYKHALRLTKYALLLSHGIVVMPASYIFEVPFIDKILSQVDLLLVMGLLQFASSTPDFQEYARRKKTEYRDELNVFSDYAKDNDLQITKRKLLWFPKTQRTSAGDISKRWKKELYNENGFWRGVLNEFIGEQGNLPSKIESEIESVPERLENRAFILRFTKPLLPCRLNLRSENQLNMIISNSYLESYLEELDATIFVDTPLGQLDCGLDQFGYNNGLRTISFREFYRFMRFLTIDKYIDGLLSWQDLVELKDLVAFRWLMTKVVENIIIPTHPLSQAIIKAHYQPQESTKLLLHRGSLSEVKAIIWKVVDAVEPILSKN